MSVDIYILVIEQLNNSQTANENSNSYNFIILRMILKFPKWTIASRTSIMYFGYNRNTIWSF